ncbi:protein of unknown function [Limnospira indica PCC 8005]|uniref:Uncharacterized protein n=1 Tax=Limnospira indica PCC 8005 TaxID=376219 RepID=A0A9P1KHG7_9CYAN|nr:protein of unknown function [Limnospira indica PCC 8005]
MAGFSDGGYSTRPYYRDRLAGVSPVACPAAQSLLRLVRHIRKLFVFMPIIGMQSTLPGWFPRKHIPCGVPRAPPLQVFKKGLPKKLGFFACVSHGGASTRLLFSRSGVV